MPDENVPKNLPVEGRSLLENVNGSPSAEKKSPVVSKPSLPPVRPAASPSPVTAKQAASVPVSPNGANDIFADIKDQPALPEKKNLKEETVVETPQRGFKKVLVTIGSIVI